MHFLRCVLAEWALVRPRLLRTRLGPWLLLLGAGLAWMGARGVDAVTVALHAGALAAVIGAAFAAGTEADRGALLITLTHPTSPFAIACGRWLAAVLPAAALSIVCSVAVGWRVEAAAAGIVAAGAVAACTLAAVLLVGNGAAVVLFICVALVGAIPPERFVDLAEPGLARLAAAGVLELGPALWRYREVATGDTAAILHAAAWTALGIVVASGLAGRRGGRR